MEWCSQEVQLGTYQAAMDRAAHELRVHRIMARIWAHDHRVWNESSAEIADRLGWLHSPVDMQGKMTGINQLVDELRTEGYRFALLLGMGGSSLAAEVWRRTFGRREGYLDLAILDSTDPGAVLDYAHNLDLRKTIFLVATKSGGTVETFSLLKYFYNLTADLLGKEETGRHFIAITDPGSALAELAQDHHFRATLLNDPHIGGRYSALSYFGLLPAALLGVDIGKFLARAAAAAASEAEEGKISKGASLGILLGELAKVGRDKLTLMLSPRLTGFGVWLEQLIAESTGKKGQGILPVVGEPVREIPAYLNDRFFVFLQIREEAGDEKFRQELGKAGHPTVFIELSDIYDLGAQCFIWEMATAVAGARLGINPFDQPDVEAAKQLARTMIAEHREAGCLPETKTPAGDGIVVYTDLRAAGPREALAAFLNQAETGAYVALQAYVQPTAETDNALSALRRQIGRKTRLATTAGYGPRFLHSTGQLHKGDGGRGLFIQITADDVQDVAIPDELGQPASSLTFGILKAAQAAGDRQALISAGRRVIRFHLGQDVVRGLLKLA